MQEIFFLISFAVLVLAQESTIPVGIDGRDTLTQIRTQDSEGNYDFGYNENQLTGGASFHRERGFSNGTKRGSYGYTTRNGLIRIVTYEADQSGFRAEVLTNEPGVGTGNPSNVTVTKEKEPDLSATGDTVGSGSSNSGSSGSPSPGSGSPDTDPIARSDVVQNYVLSGSSYTENTGSAQVMISNPYAQYYYVI